MSGGLDSSYLLHVAVKNYGLRPLVFHVDGGWNTEAAVRNINALVSGLDLELMTDVINWKETPKDYNFSFLNLCSHIDLLRIMLLLLLYISMQLRTTLNIF